MRVYILLFNAGTDNEGIHSLSAQGRNTVLMFESEDDAIRFGLMLEAQDFPSPTVESIEDEEVEEFCQGAGFACKLVPSGTLVTPPEATLDNLDWDPDRKPGERPRPKEDTPPEFSQSELDDIRQRLEGLL
ncbi:DUF3110 domain-containing protein [Leptolyngbya sp. PCC 6406]|uniref:DUF3110 domain-containing protein n=1 Tax=Leptolyngbya sp. PCC 6406 TaxID=1173264 RepID=UPI0002ABB1CF|nr:DUF3110 domain-containing protein [Leptolyngbya sp. PCC 6406]